MVRRSLVATPPAGDLVHGQPETSVTRDRVVKNNRGLQQPDTTLWNTMVQRVANHQATRSRQRNEEKEAKVLEASAKL